VCAPSSCQGERNESATIPVRRGYRHRAIPPRRSPGYSSIFSPGRWLYHPSSSVGRPGLAIWPTPGGIDGRADPGRKHAGQGAKFFVDGASAQSHGAGEGAAIQRVERVRVLVVDDNQTNRDILQQQLEGCAHAP